MSWSFHPLSYGIDCRSGSSKRLSLFRHPPRIICHSIGQLFPFVGNCKHCEYSVLVCQANRRRFYWFSSWKNKQFQWHFVAHASLIHWCLNTITLKHYHTLKASTFQTRVLLFWSIERERRNILVCLDVEFTRRFQRYRNQSNDFVEHVKVNRKANEKRELLLQ